MKAVLMLLALTLPGYAKPVKYDITEALLRKSQDHHWVALEPVYFKLSVPDTRKEWLQASRPYSVQQRRLLACYWYIEEIESGGHHQFFTNEGILCQEVEEGFVEMGCPGIVRVLIEARRTLGLPKITDTQQIRNRLDFLPLNVFRALDDKFDALNAKKEAWKSLDRYVSKHRAAFRFKGTVEVP